MSERDMEIAKTIYHQFGGSKMVAMVNMRDLCAVESGLKFTFSGCRKANKCIVTLNTIDLYDVVFYKANVRNVENPCPEVGRFEGLYFDNLNSVFEEFTGLATHL